MEGDNKLGGRGDPPTLGIKFCLVPSRQLLSYRNRKEPAGKASTESKLPSKSQGSASPTSPENTRGIFLSPPRQGLGRTMPRQGLGKIYICGFLGYYLKMVKIVQKESFILRKKAKEVPPKDISSPKIKKILKDMSDALEIQKEGVAIAAPQIGIPLRIFIVSGKVFDIGKYEKESSSKNIVFINPEITKISKDTSTEEEGCLSVRNKYGTVNRANKATIRAYDEHGKVFQRGASGLLAKIFQHEMDHLNGILFIDKVKNLHDI